MERSSGGAAPPQTNANVVGQNGEHVTGVAARRKAESPIFTARAGWRALCNRGIP
ncbi:hypothetical protein AKJ09_02661 [Labilithrix luteola]|uniref:Uncharacterized protein n=1 Tax=Labilithrix luteola TaxID=1391654 RepID=A0A0K1PR47_9BACT|nr:hypothetical protein AKJ09_02661 [Labilithrix luteola]